MNDKPKTRRYKLTIAYDGGVYAGFQLQDNGPSIQQALEEALLHVAREPVKTFGSGRTDAGVHARGQVVHCDISKPIPPPNLRRALNARLPEDIRVMRVKIVADDFDARKSTHGKEYRYFLYNADILPPTERPFRAFFKKHLDLAAMRDAARRFEGRHDFVSFAANPNREIYTTVRTIYKFTVTKKGPLFTFSVSGEGFLYKQVRSMVGFLISVGRGVERPEAVGELLAAAAPRTARVETAPPRGLFLWRVFY